MITQTQTISRPTVQANRVHDYLYDPNFVVSGEQDHVRSSVVAHASNSRIKRLPIYDTMFSDLRHCPRMEFRVDMKDPVPRFVSRQWRGNQNQQLEGVPTQFISASLRPSNVYEDPLISGANRYKYFRRPHIPFSQSLAPEVVLASARQDALSARIGTERLRVTTPTHKTIQTQTDYRESEAQTDPYSPDYVVKPGSQPELLTLALLSYGCGLPAGLAEVEMIERARAKRAWEATLPPLDDMSQLEKRRRMMEEQERKEWALREQEIEKIQEARLQVLVKLLQQREEQNEELTTKRLDRIWSRKQLEKQEQVKKIRNEFMRAIRKLTAKKAKVEGRLVRRNIVNDYSDCGSQAFAPLTRIGVFIDRLADQYVIKNRYLNTYEGLLELENSLPDFMQLPAIRAPKRQTTTSTGFLKRKYRQEVELAEIHKTLKDKQMLATRAEKPLRFLEKVERPIPRPPTPTVEATDESCEERELAAIFLQQVLRGRSIQNMMYEGKEKRIELIRELRSTHALQAAGQHAMNEQKMATLRLQKQQQLHEQKEGVVDEGLSALEGESIGDALDFLNKELIRLQEERRIHAFSMLAERRRRIREAEESGLRQVEERRRREADEIFKQVVKVHQDSVDTYLEDIILTTLTKKADEQARVEIQDVADKINDAAYEAEKSRTEMDSEEIVAELVYGFLLPEVQKQFVKEKVAKQQRKYLNAAHLEIHQQSNDSSKDLHFPLENNSGTGSRTQSRLEQPGGRTSVDLEKGQGQISRQGSSAQIWDQSSRKNSSALPTSPANAHRKQQISGSANLDSRSNTVLRQEASRAPSGRATSSMPSSRRSSRVEDKRETRSAGQRASAAPSRPDSASSRKSSSSQKRIL